MEIAPREKVCYIKYHLLYLIKYAINDLINDLNPFRLPGAF